VAWSLFLSGCMTGMERLESHASPFSGAGDTAAAENAVAVGRPSKPSAAFGIRTDVTDSISVWERSATADPERIDPWISLSVTDGVKEKVRAAFQLAVDRVRTVPECGRLFTELGADGVESLSSSLYYKADGRGEMAMCDSAVAYTHVGHRVTRLCSRFDLLPDKWAAVILIHEALHRAGLPERNLDRRAMTSAEINEMVIRACDF